ncbi:MAG: 3-phosphoshikimate 1-carboxyvinyltransferase [Gammaproteobacteria bacterium]
MLIVDGGQLSGTVAVPGDKSISHRAAILAALANGIGDVSGFLEAADTHALLGALEALGVTIERVAPGELRIHGRANAPFDDPAAPLDLGNSGTALRLIAGVLAGRGTRAVLTGDESLRRRPMARILAPLRQMGARIDAASGDTAPLTLHGGALTAIEHAPPAASAQVASCVLLAGLHADGRTQVRLPAPARDHTERMLAAYGIDTRDGVTRCDWSRVPARQVTVPGDPSSAAFVAAGAALVPGSEVHLEGLCANPLRTRFADVLERMGAEVTWTRVRTQDGEPIGDLCVRGAALRGVAIGPDEVPGLIDELPVLLAVAAFAHGPTTVDGAAELRYKESDRLATMGAGLEAMGVRVALRPGGLTLQGGRPTGGEIDAAGDHRVAMAFAIAGLRAPVRIRRWQAIATSWPAFVADLDAAGLAIKEG